MGCAALVATLGGASLTALSVLVSLMISYTAWASE